MGLDRNWRFTYLNQRAAQNVGYQPEELVGKNIWEVFPSILGTPQETFYRRVMEQHRPDQMELNGTLTQKSYQLRAYPSNEGITIFWVDTTHVHWKLVVVRVHQLGDSQAFGAGQAVPAAGA